MDFSDPIVVKSMREEGGKAQIRSAGEAEEGKRWEKRLEQMWG